MTYESKMTVNDRLVLKRNYLAGLTVVPVWEGTVVYPRTSVFIDSCDNDASKISVRKGGCCPELPV